LEQARGPNPNLLYKLVISEGERKLEKEIGKEKTLKLSTVVFYHKFYPY
jgi:hypothetical protein